MVHIGATVANVHLLGVTLAGIAAHSALVPASIECHCRVEVEHAHLAEKVTRRVRHEVAELCQTRGRANDN